MYCKKKRADTTTNGKAFTQLYALFVHGKHFEIIIALSIQLTWWTAQRTWCKYIFIIKIGSHTWFNFLNWNHCFILHSFRIFLLNEKNNLNIRFNCSMFSFFQKPEQSVHFVTHEPQSICEMQSAINRMLTFAADSELQEKRVIFMKFWRIWRISWFFVDDRIAMQRYFVHCFQFQDSISLHEPKSAVLDLTFN